MSTCNRLDLQTLGSQPIMPKNLPDHCSEVPKLLTNSIYQDLLQLPTKLTKNMFSWCHEIPEYSRRIISTPRSIISFKMPPLC